jgi:hypothetical protein
MMTDKIRISFDVEMWQSIDWLQKFMYLTYSEKPASDLESGDIMGLLDFLLDCIRFRSYSGFGDYILDELIIMAKRKRGIEDKKESDDD